MNSYFLFPKTITSSLRNFDDGDETISIMIAGTYSGCFNYAVMGDSVLEWADSDTIDEMGKVGFER